MNGLASLNVVMARHLPADIARNCATDAQITLSHIDAVLLASPQSDATAKEMQKVFSEGIRIFEMAAKTDPNGQ
jgi:hypothetical protein